MNKVLLVVILALGLVLPAGDVVAQQGKGKGKPDAEMREQRERAEDMREQAEERAEQAEERVEKERERAEVEEGFGHDLDDDPARSRERGSERAQAMRERRDDRKEIQNEYREQRVDGEGSDAAREGDDDEKKDKKPWWKFWGD